MLAAKKCSTSSMTNTRPHQLTPYGAQGLDRLAEYDYVAIFDADFKPDSDFLVSR